MVTPDDVVMQLSKEFPTVGIQMYSEDEMDATLTFHGQDAKQARARASELAKKAQLFNAHLELGHAGNKRNWWKRV